MLYIMRYSIRIVCVECISKEGRGVPNGGKFPSTRLITCRSSKEHRHLHSVGECEGSKYVCTVHTGKIRCSFEERLLSAECSEASHHLETPSLTLSRLLPSGRRYSRTHSAWFSCIDQSLRNSYIRWVQQTLYKELVFLHLRTWA